MLGKLGKSWGGIAIAAVLIVVGAVLIWRQLSGGGPPVGQGGDQVRVCLAEGHKSLAESARAGDKPVPCPECGGETVIGRVFECQKGHLFVGYLEKPADPAAATDDPYKQHMPRMLRPGVDTEWAPGGAGQPVCPVCRTGVKRPVVALEGEKLEDVEMGKLPAGGGGR
jgi:hypothetical protein